MDASNSVDEPLFDCPHHALMFAFHFNLAQVAMTPMAKLIPPKGRLSGKGLTGVNGAAESGLIRAHVNKLPVLERNILVARYSVEKEGIEAKMSLIIPVVAALPTGLTHRRMIDHLIQRYFGEKIRLGQLAGMFGVHPNTVTDKWRSSREWLREREATAQILISDRLQQAGVVVV